MEQKLKELRSCMSNKKLVPTPLTAYVIPTEDAHQVWTAAWPVYKPHKVHVCVAIVFQYMRIMQVMHLIKLVS